MGPKYQFFTIPPFGFGKTFFESLPKKDEIEFIYLDYQFEQNWAQMTAGMVAKVKTLANKPFIIYGHSMGGIVAYELSVALESQTNLRPKALMLSSVPSPAIFSRVKYTFPFNQMSPGASDENIQRLMDANRLPEPQWLSSEMIDAEVQAILSYRNCTPKPVFSPIIYMQTSDDVLNHGGNLASEWQKLTSSNFSYLEVENARSIEAFEKACHETDRPRQLVPTVYRLKEYISGSGHNATNPYGLEPQGFLLYDESSGSMAVAIWDPYIREIAKPLNTNDESAIIAFMTDYFCYCGNYTTYPGLIEHHVNTSIFPNHAGDTLARLFSYDGENLILSDFTKTRVHQIPESFDKLVWAPMPLNPQICSIAGTWKIVDYQESGSPVWFANIAGQMNVTSTGYIAMQIASGSQKQWRDNAQLLATNDELVDSYTNYRSLFAKYQCLEKDAVLICEDLTPNAFEPGFSISYSIENDRLELNYKLRRLGNSKEIAVKSHWQKIDHVMTGF
jgi:surfactin synthase thioesterase subunit